MIAYKKEIKKRAECIVKLCKHAGIFYEHSRSADKHEPKASTFRTSRVFLKILKRLYNSAMLKEQAFLLRL